MDLDKCSNCGEYVLTETAKRTHRCKPKQYAWDEEAEELIEFFADSKIPYDIAESLAKAYDQAESAQSEFPIANGDIEPVVIVFDQSEYDQIIKLSASLISDHEEKWKIHTSVECLKHYKAGMGSKYRVAAEIVAEYHSEELGKYQERIESGEEEE